MHTSSEHHSSLRLTRRSYSAAFKAQVVAESQHPGTSIAAVAQAHGINANLVHKWRRESSLTLTGQGMGNTGTAALDFIALPLPAQMPSGPSTGSAASISASSHIEVQLHQGKTMRPVAAAADCATWLRAVLT